MRVVRLLSTASASRVSVEKHGQPDLITLIAYSIALDLPRCQDPYNHLASKQIDHGITSFRCSL